MPDDEKTPLDQVLDLFVYAPLGLALSVREQLPKLADRGRQQMTGQMTMAKMIGQFAAQQGQREAEKALRRAGERAEQVLGDLFGPDVVPERVPPADAVRREPARRDDVPAPEPVAAAPAPPVESLAIPGYDTLSASQVVQRLAGLAPDELAAVRDYEAATRKRRTILNRVAQLQAG